MNKVAVYPGTFDPITYGHIDIIKRAARLYNRLYVAVAYSPSKNPLFSISERLDMVKKSTKSIKNVKVESFDTLIVDYVRDKKSCVVIRGLRMISDFEYELQMALTNRKLARDVETIFMMPNESYSYLSSKLIREAALLGADVSNFVPKFVENILKKKLKSRG